MTIAQQLEITEFPYEIRNKAGQQIYYVLAIYPEIYPEQK